MKLYHGTNNAYEIESEGFLGSELSEFTDGFTNVENGVVFFKKILKKLKNTVVK